MIISDLMNEDPGCVAPSSAFQSVVDLMTHGRHSCVLVSERNIPIGIITERDVVRYLANQLGGRQATELRCIEGLLARALMTLNPVCVSEDLPVYDGLLLARRHHFRHLPVVGPDRKLVGLVTLNDMADAYIENLERQAELESENRNLRQLANEDPLMKIGNRRAMEEALKFANAMANRYEGTYAIAILDVDFFKAYNDNYGHQAGDIVLTTIAQTIRSRMRRTDKLFRYGGEEILMLLHEVRDEDALTATEGARAAIEALGIPHRGSPNGLVTISAGVVSEKGEAWTELLARADKALYAAKQSGRNRIVEASAPHRIHLASDTTR